MLIEVVTCTHNREALLLRMLGSLLRVRRPESMQLLITVVANNCQDNTLESLQRLQNNIAEHDCEIRVMQEPTPGKSHALNLALSHAKGDWLCFIDDDHRIDEGYFDSVVRAVSTFPDATAFCGRIIPDWDGSEPQWAHRADQYAIYPLPVPRYDKGDESQAIGFQDGLPGGGNIVLKRSALAGVGLFSTKLGPVGHNLVGAEDLDFMRRFLSRGNRLFYLSGMVQYHWVDASRFTLRYVANKAYLRSKDTTLVKQPDATHVPRYLIRKLAGYLLRLLWPIPFDRARFFTVRVAATLGEIQGFKQVVRRKKQ